MGFEDKFLKALQDGNESIYDSFVRMSSNALPQDANERYAYLRSDAGKFIARDEADVDVYVDRVAKKHLPKFKWLYENLFKSQNEIFSKKIDIVVWGCGCGLDLLAFYDCAMKQKNPQLWVTIRHVTLVDISDAALKRAKIIANILFPLANVSVIKCDLSNPDEITRKVRLPRLIGFVPRIHLISNLLDLFPDATELARAVRDCSARQYVNGYLYYNEYVVAFSPEYRNGRVKQNIKVFREVWRNGDYNGEEMSDVSAPQNCEFSLFAYRTLRNDRCYKSFMGGNNFSLKKLVEECPEVIQGFDFIGFVQALSQIKVFGRNFYRQYRWVEVCRYKDSIDRIIFVANPNCETRPAPCVVEFPHKNDDIEKAAERALRHLNKQAANDSLRPDGRKCDFAVLKWDGNELKYKVDDDKELKSNVDDDFWRYDGEVDYSLYFRIDSGDVEPLPNLNEMDEKQQEIIYSRKQYRKIRGGAGCGKSTTMLWHAVMSVMCTHLPVLLLCKTVTLFTRNKKRIAATLLREIPGLTYVDSDMVRFMTLDKMLCGHSKDRDGCVWFDQCSKCEGCNHEVKFKCKDFKPYYEKRLQENQNHRSAKWRILNDAEKARCCEVCVRKNIEALSRKGTIEAKKSTAYGAVLIDEVQSIDPELVQAVVNLTYGGNQARECYVFCDERQSLRKDAVEVDLEKNNLRVKVPDRGAGYGRWIDLNKPYRASNDFTGRLVDVALRLQSLTVAKYGDVELVKTPSNSQMELSGSVFRIRWASKEKDLVEEIFAELENVKSNGIDTITIICDNPDDVCQLLHSEKTQNWISTHTINGGHEEEQRLRASFGEVEGRIHLTTVTLAQGWDFENVIFVCSKENTDKKNVLENVLTGATRATNSMLILDRTVTGWLYNELKDLSQ